MPARMWRHGIHSFLELLRHRLPRTSEYILSFVYMEYSMMAMLYETVPAFEDTWRGCLGDLSRCGLVYHTPRNFIHTRATSKLHRCLLAYVKF
jgi:hypothetical protein